MAESYRVGSNNSGNRNQSTSIEQNNKIGQTIQNEEVSAAKKKFEDLQRLWRLYKKDDKEDESAVLAGPMDILRQVGQFLITLSDTSKLEKNSTFEGDLVQTLQDGNNAALMATLQGNTKVASTEHNTGSVDLEALEKLATYIENSASQRNVKAEDGVRVHVPQHVLPQTDIVLKEVEGVMQVQIVSDDANAISLLGRQGSVLQQMLENKLQNSVIVEVNAERVTRKEDNNHSSQDEQRRRRDDEEGEFEEF